MKQTNEPGPRLAALLASGDVKLDGSEYVGRTVDGDEVTLGHVSDCAGIERYLSGFPTPSEW